MADLLRIALILGSAREGRFCDTVLDWVKQEINKREGVELDVIDPLNVSLPRRIERIDGSATKALCARIERADAFVVVTPEYNHGYPAALKEIIDSAYAEWNAKPVAFVSYGGAAGGVRAVEQLRLVFAELHAVTIRDTVSFSNPWNDFPSQRATSALDKMFDRLWWWSTALKHARGVWPYEERPQTGVTEGALA